MEYVIAVTVFIAVTSLFAALFIRPPSDIERRLNVFKDMAGPAEEEPEKEPNFIERVVRPVTKYLMRWVRIILPPTMLNKLQWKLTQAGEPCTLNTLLAVWAGLVGPLPLTYFLIASRNDTSGMPMLIALAGAIILGMVPYVWLDRKRQDRQKRILKRLPDAIDLLSTSVEAGLGIDAALGQVAEKIGGPIGQEIRRMLREMSMGSARKEALRSLADRTGVPDVKMFVNALIQAEEMGVSLASVIRVQADQMRTKRRQRAEEAAHKAPVKITVPLVLFIFPTILVVILGPAFLQIKDGLGPAK